MKVSYSRIDTFKMCPYKYKLQYIDKLKTKFNLDPANALILGTAIHTGIEKNTLEAIKGYYSNYPSVTPSMINEAIKLEIMIYKAKRVLPEGEYELCLDDEDFIGYMDLLVPVDKSEYTKEETRTREIIGLAFGSLDDPEYETYTKTINLLNPDYEWYDLYDFKYSNDEERYKKSGQLHIYKNRFEKLNPGKKIRNMKYVLIPKVKLKQEEFESIEEYRDRLIALCEEQEVKFLPIKYDANKVIEFLIDTKHCIECQEFNKNPNKLCYFCDFRKYCQSDGKEDSNIIYPEDNEESEE